MMDRRRPEVLLTLPVRVLSFAGRVWRSSKRGLAVTGVVLLIGNLALIVIPAPHVHLCLFPIAFVLGPIVSAFTWRDTVTIGTAPIDCPRCRGALTVPDDLGGWPARFNCHHCGIMVELNQA
jgi:hypothetical protein